MLEGDCLEVMAGMPARSVDAIVTDPPYGLGFMGREWDALPPGREWAEACRRVLKPGAHLVAFGGTRTWHRLVCSLEDAGFEVRDTLVWLHGNGMPKSRALLKPAWEPATLCRVPLEAPLAQNVTAWGTGTLNLDACRPASGRWPANVVVDPDAAAAIDAHAGERSTSSGRIARNADADGRHSYGTFAGGVDGVGYGDYGGPARFYYCAKAAPAERGDGNDHPTVKPLDLMRWLVRLVVPAGGVVLDPFAGSGSTLVAATMEGVESVGIERDAHYCEVARRRCAGVLSEPRLFAVVA